jgi:hypothetical protein
MKGNERKKESTRTILNWEKTGSAFMHRFCNLPKLNVILTEIQW